MKKNKKLNNKGFSLVELIIVIAIMAVLVGVLAPQFTKYVGQSKDATDKTNVELLRTTASAVLADTSCDFSVEEGKSSTFDVIGGKEPTADSSNFVSLMTSAIGTWPTPQESGKMFQIKITGAAGGGYTVEVDVVAATGGES